MPRETRSLAIVAAIPAPGCAKLRLFVIAQAGTQDRLHSYAPIRKGE
jgi:hypothetical protein